MSQSSAPLDGTTEDAFLSSSDQDQFSQADFQELFGVYASDEDAFSPSNTEAFDGIGFSYEAVSLASVDSASSSAISTPNLSCYSFDQHKPTYPTPEPEKPRPYPFESRKPYDKNASQQVLSYRPPHVRSHTNNARLCSSPLPHPGLRRRSLSYSDIDRIAGAASMPNPTFIRLQAPRTRTTTSEEYQRRELNAHCGRNPCRISQARGRSTEPTSIPYSLHSSPLIGGMLPTPIGTPLNEVMGLEDTNCDANTLYPHHSIKAASMGFPIFSGDPICRPMSHPEELARSHQIIEIGALAVTNRAKVDPRLEPHDPVSDRECMLRKLVDIEEHLKKTGGDEVLGSCNTIRRVLTEETECEGKTQVANKTLKGETDAARSATAEGYAGVFDGRDDDEIMATMMRQHGAGDSAAE